MVLCCTSYVRLIFLIITQVLPPYVTTRSMDARYGLLILESLEFPY